MTSFHSIGSMTDRSDAAYEYGIPRYAEPDFIADEPNEGMCYNCDHRVVVELGGIKYHLCVQERDDRKGGQLGDVHECDRDADECADWCWNGSWEAWEDVYGV